MDMDPNTRSQLLVVGAIIIAFGAVFLTFKTFGTGPTGQFFGIPWFTSSQVTTASSSSSTSDINVRLTDLERKYNQLLAAVQACNPSCASGLPAPIPVPPDEKCFCSAGTLSATPRSASENILEYDEQRKRQAECPKITSQPTCDSTTFDNGGHYCKWRCIQQ
ncbi:MAG TPA: hypothetical protein VJC07_01560 [Candidatus Nanoarchaeia archaeon]|nr:hypothetical protein [Candidatus Nanoarchaeia archaeon]